MIELCLLGLQAVRDSDGRDLSSLPAQPKRFALLAYLAIGGGSGYHRRDSLAAMFWPDLDQFAARRALRNTLYHLREALGDGVIVTRGDDAVSIDAERLTCDLTRLGEAVAAGRYEEAVDGFTGELLAGIHFPNAGEGFEEWLCQERLHVAEQVMRALRALVEREQSSGNLLMAARWAQRACALAPGDESWLRRAMGLLDQGGDTGGALRIYEASARRLAAEFDATPSAETEALAAQIRDGSRKPVTRVDTSPLVVSASRAEPPEQAPVTVALTTSTRAAPRRTLLWLTGLGVVAVLILAGVARARHQHGPEPRGRVLVEVFDNRTGDSELQSLGRMAQDWLSQGIMRTQLVDVVDPRAVFVQSRTTGGAPVDPAILARRTGATLLVSGSYYRTGDTLFLEAAVTDVKTGRMKRVVGPILSSARTPVAGLDELRSRVMSALASAVEVRATQDLRGDEIPPFEAYRDYVDGWDAFWHGDPHAKLLFLRALQLDSGFTAAALGAATAAANSNDCPLVDSLTRALNLRSQPLERRDRLGLQISDARCRGRNEEMLRLALERADLEPGSSAYQMPAAGAALWANRPKRALEVLNRVNPDVDLAWSTDTTHAAYWGDLAEAFHALGRHREELAATDRMPPGAALDRVWLRGSALAALSRPTAALALIDSSLSLPVETASDIGLAPYTDGRPQYTVTPAWVACWIARELEVHGDSVAARQAASRAVAWYRGRSLEERSTIEERLVEAWSLEVLGEYSQAEELARQLVAEDSTNVDFRGELANLAAEQGDTAGADSGDRWLAQQPVSRVSWTASVYRADVAALLGRRDAAIARTRDALDEGAWPRWIHTDPALAGIRARQDFIALTAPRD